MIQMRVIAEGEEDMLTTYPGEYRSLDEQLDGRTVTVLFEE